MGVFEREIKRQQNKEISFVSSKRKSFFFLLAIFEIRMLSFGLFQFHCILWLHVCHEMEASRSSRSVASHRFCQVLTFLEAFITHPQHLFTQIIMFQCWFISHRIIDNLKEDGSFCFAKETPVLSILYLLKLADTKFRFQ